MIWTFKSGTKYMYILQEVKRTFTYLAWKFLLPMDTQYLNAWM